MKEDYRIPFEEKNESVKKLIDELSEDINSFKSTESNNFIRFETCVTDANNIHLIKERRNGQSRNIFETKYFFISADQALRRWDFKTNQYTPIVVLPSQWLSILLRYVNRTNDDFKSFVSFLNLSQNETNINNEKLQLILIGISEITQDVVKQSAIVEVMVEQKFKGILENNTSEDEIIELAKNFAKSELEKRLDEIETTNQILTDSIASHIEGSKSLIYDVDLTKQAEAEKTKIFQLDNRKLKKELRDNYVKKQYFEWRLLAYFSIPVILFFIILYILPFSFQGWTYNYPLLLSRWIDSLPKDSMKHKLGESFYLIPLGGIAPLTIIVYNRLVNKEKIYQKLKNIEETVPRRYW